MARARAGRLWFIDGCRHLVDATHIDNAVHAHLLAAEYLRAHPATLTGRTYFIANGEPMPMCELINRIVQAADLPAIRRSLPAVLAQGVAVLLEGAARIRGRQQEPLLTRFVVAQLRTAHWYDLHAAESDLGYQRQVDTKTGMLRLRKWLQENDLSVVVAE